MAHSPWAWGRARCSSGRQERAYFVSAVNTLAQGRLVPVPGGVLIQNSGTLLGAVGVSGDTSDNDEICAIAGIEAAGLKANPG
jgi:uncharacterized protein GlcG (DUF336 family)